MFVCIITFLYIYVLNTSLADRHVDRRNNLHRYDDTYDTRYEEYRRRMFDDFFRTKLKYQDNDSTKLDEESLDYGDLSEQFNDDWNCKVKSIYKHTNTDLDLLIQTLERMMNFWNRNYKSVIVDGLFGMRFAEGSLDNALKSISSLHPYYDKLYNLQTFYHKVCEKSYANIRKQDKSYVATFLKLIDRPFRFQRPWQQYDKDLVWNINHSEHMNESESDRCISLLLGQDGKMPCTVTKKCLREELLGHTSNYYLTHQALYFIVGETNGCHDNLVRAVGTEEILQKLYDNFGSNIYSQMMKNNLNDQSDSRTSWDIFAEQGLVCGILGVVECLRIDKLRESLSWVSHNGCLYNSQRNGIGKRVDSLIGLCSQHLTAVAMGYYALHLKFMLDPPDCDMLQ